MEPFNSTNQPMNFVQDLVFAQYDIPTRALN